MHVLGGEKRTRNAAQCNDPGDKRSRNRHAGGKVDRLLREMTGNRGSTRYKINERGETRGDDSALQRKKVRQKRRLQAAKTKAGRGKRACTSASWSKKKGKTKTEPNCKEKPLRGVRIH